MEGRGFPLAFSALAELYARGLGVPLNRDKAALYARCLYEPLRKPVKGGEDQRYEALLSVDRSLQEGETARYGRWQFMNLRGLAEAEQLVLWSEELPTMLLRLAE